jgi:FkbM family methyltransferase
MRQYLIGTWAGRRLESARNQINLATSLLFRPEQIGTEINDQIATWLTYHLCTEGRVFIDVGAHIGSVIAGVLHNSKPRKIIAIEPIPSKAAQLRRRFPQVIVVDTALGEMTGQTKFHVNLKQSGFSSLVPGNTDPNGRGTSQIEVKIARLDDIIDDKDVDLVKIDVEGAEVGVIRGGGRILQACRPLVLFESGPPLENALGYTKDQLWKEWAELDYTIVIPNRLPHDDHQLDHAGFIESHAYPRRTTNYFAVPKERRLAMREHARAILNRSPFRPLLR